MKFLTFIFSIILAGLVCSCENTPTDKPEKEYKVTTYVEPGHYLFKEEYYTKEGLKTKQTEYDTTITDSSVFKSTTEYDYDDQNIVKATRYLTENGEILSQDLYENTYNSNGSLIYSFEDEYWYDTKVEYEYNANNQLIRKRQYPRNQLHYIGYYFYDNSGFLIRQEKREPVSDTLYETTTYSYNSANEMYFESTTTFESDVPYQSMEYLFNNVSQVIQEKKAYLDYDTELGIIEITETTLYERDEKGRIISKKVDGNPGYITIEYSNDDFIPEEPVYPHNYDLSKLSIAW